MARTPAEVTDAELAILQALWDARDCTIRQLTDRLYPAGNASCYATVQKLLERLEAKGCVRRDRSTAVHTFTPAVCRDDLIGRGLRTVAEKLCGGSIAPLLTNLVKLQRLSPTQRQELRDLIDQLDTGPKKNRKPTP